jgi:hypothetical protein
MLRILQTAIVSMALLAGTAMAQSAPQYWVTYAHDTKTGAWGLGWGKTDRQATINDALSRCAKPGCKSGDVTLARCIAAAQGNQGGPWFAAGNDANTAQGHAMRFCRNGGAGSTCEVQAVRCGG